VHTGCEHGCSEIEQKLYGSRWRALLPPLVVVGLLALKPAPALAPYASPDAHSECVIWIEETGQRASKGGVLVFGG